MAAAVAPIFQVAGRFSPIQKTPAGWVGSKAGSRNHFVTVDASGFIDQAAAVTNAVATVRVGLLNNDVASTVAQSSTEALGVSYRQLTDETYIELPLITSGTSLVNFVSVANTRVGDLVGLARRTAGDYCWDTTGTDYAKVISADAARGTLTCVVLSTMRLP